MGELAVSLTETLTGPVRHWWDLGFNRAVPDDLLIRLLDVEPGFLSRKDLSPTVLDAAVDHPDRYVRGTLFDRGTGLLLTPEQWGRLLLNESGAAREQVVVETAAWGGVRLPPDCHETLVASPSPFVRAEAARLPGMTATALRTLAADPVPRVRAAAATLGSPRVWSPCSSATATRPSATPSPCAGI